MRNGLVLAAALVAAPVWSAEPAPPPRPAARLVTRAYPVASVIHPAAEPPAPCAPLGTLRPVEKVDVVQAAAVAPVAPCPLPAPMPSSKALRENGEKLVRLVTGNVRPDTWVEAGGRGSANFYPTGMTLVVCQTAAVQAEVAEYLEALRRAADTHVMLEFRIVELPDTFFERVGADFEPAAPGRPACVSPAPTAKVTAKRVPGVLTEAQLKRFLQLVQSDRRASVVHAPKVVTVDRQSATVQATDTVTFLTGLEIALTANGLEQKAHREAADLGTRITATPRVSADRTTVELDIGYQFAALERVAPGMPVQLAGATDAAGEVLQRPMIRAGDMQAKFCIPVGHTAVLTGPRFHAEGCQEFGPAVAAKIPYLNQLFRDTGDRRASTQHLLLVTARVIEPSEVAPPACKECRADKPAAVSGVAKLVAAYKTACAEGRTEDAMKLALQALAQDPTCFADEE